MKSEADRQGPHKQAVIHLHLFSLQFYSLKISSFLICIIIEVVLVKRVVK